jgi:hypothetical protein
MRDKVTSTITLTGNITAITLSPPILSNFYTTDAVMQQIGNDATALNAGLQVGRGEYPLFRKGMTMYEVKENMTVGFSQATANTDYGPGGFDQYFIVDHEVGLLPIMTRLMENR